MKKNIFTILACTLMTVLFLNDKLYSQPTIEWIKNFGGSAEEGNVSIEQTEDGGYKVGCRW